VAIQYDPIGRMKLIDPAGNEYVYDFPADGTNQSSVTYPDGSRRVYSYNEPENFVNGIPNTTYLTGISDEITPGNLVRYSIYKYNGSLPISTEHVAGANKFSFDYANSTVTDPLGTVRWYEFEKVNGRQMQKRYSQPDGYGSTAATNTVFDDNGNTRVTWDLKGIATIHNFDQISNLEVSRVEASGTADARIMHMQWDTTLRKPLAIAAPQLRTTFTYDAAGNVLTRSEQATSDLDGAQGFNAALVGIVRRWTYTYNPMGLLLTTRGPRTDVNDTSTNAYDVAGNLTSVTNAMNQVVILSNYDANGHVGRITDPNGLVTDLVYTPRGWISSVKRGVETTSYSYDGVGHLTQVTNPDNTAIYYSYDAAQRLTGIADNLGNSIAYTLDPMGNRVKEQILDSSGALSRQTSRVIDVLNRLQQVTGGQQ
jgi:YD repeat-containing protein